MKGGPASLHYYFNDHLGTTSVVTSAAGMVQKESDYFPYGGEIAIVSGDTNRYKFTGKERDSESGLDMFGARYYGSSLGRFMTPDWASKPVSVPYANFGNPQSLNLYSYVQNNPTTVGDPDGHCFWDLCIGEAEVAAAVFVAAVAYLESPSGQKGLQAAGKLLDKAVNAASDAVADAFAYTGDGAVSGIGSGGISTAPYGVINNPLNSSAASQNAQGQSTPAQPPSGMQPKPGASGGPGAGKKINDKTKAEALKENEAANGGQAKCVYCKEPVGPGTKNKINYDHSQARAKDGTNDLNNVNVTCEYCNKSKGTGPAPVNPKDQRQN